MEDFVNKIAEKYDLDPDATREFAAYLDYIVIGKSEHIVESGAFNDNFYIIGKGILRAYISDEEEQTLWFGYPGQAIVDVWCYHYRRPSRISIEAVIPCELFTIPKTALEELCRQLPAVCNIIRKIFIGHAAEMEESSTSLFECDGGLERYLSILQRHPELLQNVPLKKLASYIRLAPQSLSRIRARIK